MTPSDTHVDTQVTNAVAALLTGIVGPDGAAVPVLQSRQFPDTPNRPSVVAFFLPTVAVQQHDKGTPGSRVQRRTLRLKVNVVMSRAVGVEDGLEDDVRAVCLQVENRMSQGFALTNPDHVRIATKVALAGRDTGLVPGGTRTKLVGSMTFVLTIDHREGAAQTALPQLTH